MVTLCRSWFPRHWVTYLPPTWTISFTGVCYWAWSRKLARSREDCRKFGVWQDGKGIVCFKKCMGTSLSPLVFTLYRYEGSISKYGIIKNLIIMDKMAFEWKVCLQYFLLCCREKKGDCLSGLTVLPHRTQNEEDQESVFLHFHRHSGYLPTYTVI